MAQPEFEPSLGFGPGAISDDGKTIATGGISAESEASCDAHASQAFRWTEAAGADYLDGVCGAAGSVAVDVSGDGSVFLYEILAGSGGSPFDCGLWSESTGAVPLDAPAEGFERVDVQALAPDGKWVAADWRMGAYTVPFVWSVDEHTWHRLVAEDDQMNGHVSVVARGGVAAAVQYRFGTTQDSMYMRWTPSGGATALPLPPGVTVHGPQNFAITSDGSAIVAAPIGAFGSLVFWLGDGSQYVVASSGVTLDGVARVWTSDDLRIVIGTTFQDGGRFPGIWTPRHGTRRIADALEAAGVDLTGWTLTRVSDITPDGNVIVGSGTNPMGGAQGFRIIGRLYCSPDCNDDGRLNINDFICFQAKWRAQDFYADYNLDGKWNVNDYIAFQADWQRGCH